MFFKMYHAYKNTAKNNQCKVSYCSGHDMSLTQVVYMHQVMHADMTASLPLQWLHLSPTPG